MTRKAVKKSVRFEVFKRDSFTCQYCGSKAPDVILELEHIHPVSKGGGNDIVNLLAACVDCNSGKSDKTLDDSTAVRKQHLQLESLQERKNQIEMICQWRAELRGIDDIIKEALSREFDAAFGYAPTAESILELYRVYKKHDLQEASDCIAAAGDLYSHLDEADAVKKVGGIAVCRERERARPGSGRLSYILAILRNRFENVNPRTFFAIMDEALEQNICMETVERTAKEINTWYQFKTSIENYSIRHRCGDFDEDQNQ